MTKLKYINATRRRLDLLKTQIPDALYWFRQKRQKLQEDIEYHREHLAREQQIIKLKAELIVIKQKYGV